MGQSEQVKLTSNHASSAEFYVRSPFRNYFFTMVTGVFALALICWALILVAGWRYLPLQVIILLAFVICFLIAIYRLGLRVHERIHVLFETGQIGKLDKGSPLDKVLGATTNMILSGLFLSLALVVLCLVSLGKVLFLR
jgi:hypothetical protein